MSTSCNNILAGGNKMVKHKKVPHQRFRVRPDDATAEQALKLREAGMTWAEIGKFWGGISGQAVINVVKKAHKKGLLAVSPIKSEAGA